MWTLRALVVTHVLLDYGYMDDVTENFFFCSVHTMRGFENVCVIYFALSE